MKPLTVFLVGGFSLVHGATSDLAYVLLNNAHAARAEFPSEVNGTLARFSVLPPKLLSLIRTSMDSGFSHSFLAHVARYSVSNLELASKCVDESDNLKGFQMCMLRETGMNPHFIRLMECMPHYEKWHDISPVVNEEQRHDVDLHIPVKYWSMNKFVESVIASDESVTEGFNACVARIEQFTVGFVTRNLFSPANIENETESSILRVLGSHENVLVQVPLPLAYAPIKNPSHLIPFIIRHFMSQPKYQSILDHMSYDWSLMPLDTLEMMLSHISAALDNWPLTTELSPRFKYFDYSYNSSFSTKLWWNTFYGAMKSDEAFIESLIIATGKFLKLPQDDFSSLNNVCKDLPQKSMSDIVEAIGDFRDNEMKNELVAIDIQPEGRWGGLRSCDRSAYKPRLDELKLKIEKYLAMTYNEFPSNPDNLDIFMIKSFLDQPYFRSSLNLAVVALHPFFFSRQKSFMKMLVDGIVEGIECDELLNRLWAVNDDSVWHGPMATDIQKFLQLPEVVDLKGTLTEVKQRMHKSLVAVIKTKGGDDFAVLDYKDASAFPEIIQTLLDIHRHIEQNRGMAYWMAVTIPIFANPAFPRQAPKTTLAAILRMCNPYVLTVVNDPVLVALLEMIFQTASLNRSSKLALEALDVDSIKALVQLSRVNVADFTYAIIRTPNFILADLWPNIADDVLTQLDFPVEDQTGLEALNDFDSTLNYLRAQTNGAKVDLDKVFLSEEDSMKILHENPDVCAVCLGVFLDHEGKVVKGDSFGALNPCKHLYHHTCFKYAVADKPKVTCPICHQAVVEVQSP